MVQLTFAIQGMHCEACVRRLSAALGRLPGVHSAKVTLSPPRALIQASDISFEALAAAARGAGNYELTDLSSASGNPPPQPEAAPSATARPVRLYPLALIVAYILAIVLLAAWSRAGRPSIASLMTWQALDWHSAMTDFMAAFFLIFSFFKLLDLRGFADAYQSYDLLARPFRPWALAYPFIELSLGLAYFLRWSPMVTNAATLILMLIGAAGVFTALRSGTRVQCACLGTALNLPMTTITLIEDITMAAMAAAGLAWEK